MFVFEAKIHPQVTEHLIVMADKITMFLSRSTHEYNLEQNEDDATRDECTPRVFGPSSLTLISSSIR